jgi:hypothetical protein
VSFDELITALYEERERPAHPDRALLELRRRTNESLDAAGLRVCIERRGEALYLSPLP